MRATEALERLGGIAGRQALLRLTSRRQLRKAVRTGQILRITHGRYASRCAAEARVAAARLAGVLCLRSAAAAHGWELKTLPPQPEIAVNPRRRIEASRRDGVRLCWMAVAVDDVEAGVTSPLRTVIDCARQLPFDEALAIADSALRSGALTPDDLAGVRVQGAGAAAVRRVLAHADARAANPFESVLRALCIEVGLEVEPQAEVDLGSGRVHPDVVVWSLGAAIEADSWTFHASRKAHRRDCARYNLLVLRGWRVLRFTYEQVMHEQSYVRWILEQLATVPDPRRVGQDKVAAPLPRSA